MGFIEEIRLSLETNGSGVGSATSNTLQNVAIKAVSVVYDSAPGGCSLAVTKTSPSETPITISGNTDAVYYTQATAVDNTGSALAGTGTDYVIANGAITVTATTGGASKTHIIKVYVERLN